MGEFLAITIIIVLSFSLLLFTIFRIEWVKHKTHTLYMTDFDKYQKLVSYEKIVLTFWVWDIERFIQK